MTRPRPPAALTALLGGSAAYERGQHDGFNGAPPARTDAEYVAGWREACTTREDALAERERTKGRDIMADGNTVAQKLGISVDELNAMFTNVPVGGYDGQDVATDLRIQYRVDFDEPLGATLAAQGVLTAEEGAWLDDTDA